MSENEKPKIDFGIRDDIEEARKLSTSYIEQEQERVRDGREPWVVYDASASNYAIHLNLPDKYLKLPEESRIHDFIENEYNDRLGALVGIELGGPGSRLFEDLNQGTRKFAKTLGVTLKDFRAPHQITTDNNNHHEVLEANILSSGYSKDGVKYPGFEKIQKWTEENGKADFIIEVMHGPNRGYNNSSDFYLYNILRWYNILAINGTLLAEVPIYPNQIEKLEELKPRLNSANVELDIQPGIEFGIGYMRVKRLKDSPNNLESVLR